MLNTIAAYTECGTSAAKAMNKKDVGLYDHHHRWLSKALALESAENKKIARMAYDTAYKECRHAPRPLLFA